MHLLASSLYAACGLSLILGVVIFARNLIVRGDADFEARFPWWMRLSLYLVVLLIPPMGWSSSLSTNTPWWVPLLLAIVGFSIPLVGLLSCLWLGTVRKTRARVKLARGLLLVSLVPIVFFVSVSVDPATRTITDCFDPSTRTITDCTSVF